MLRLKDIDKKLVFLLSEPKIVVDFGRLSLECRRDSNFSLKSQLFTTYEAIEAL